MATFKVGDRVRKIALSLREGERVPLGSVGVIVGTAEQWGYEWRVEYEPPIYTGAYDFNVAHSWMLAPLTDPRCSEFIADMERFSKLVPA
jgi:hypothetical protein